jgi:hypothetical protein
LATAYAGAQLLLLVLLQVGSKVTPAVDACAFGIMCCCSMLTAAAALLLLLVLLQAGSKVTPAVDAYAFGIMCCCSMLTAAAAAAVRIVAGAAAGWRQGDASCGRARVWHYVLLQDANRCCCCCPHCCWCCCRLAAR